MNTYHFVDEPLAKSDVNKLIKKLEEVMAGSFTRQIKAHAEKDSSDDFVRAEEQQVLRALYSPILQFKEIK